MLITLSECFVLTAIEAYYLKLHMTVWVLKIPTKILINFLNTIISIF